MADQLYFTIIRVMKGKGKGQFELHNSLKRKDVAKGRPRCMARAISFADKPTYRVAVHKIQEWRVEMKFRFGAKEVEPENQVHYD